MTINPDRLKWLDRDCPRHHAENGQMLGFVCTTKGASKTYYSCIKCFTKCYEDIPNDKLWDATQEDKPTGRKGPYATTRVVSPEEKAQKNRENQRRLREANPEKVKAYQKEYHQKRNARLRQEKYDRENSQQVLDFGDTE